MSDGNLNSPIIVDYLLLALFINVGTAIQTIHVIFGVLDCFLFISSMNLYWLKLQDFGLLPCYNITRTAAHGGERETWWWFNGLSKPLR